MIRYEVYERKARHEINDPRFTMGDIMMESPRRENNDEAKIPNKLSGERNERIYKRRGRAKRRERMLLAKAKGRGKSKKYETKNGILLR